MKQFKSIVSLIFLLVFSCDVMSQETGCTDSLAFNYNAAANSDDGSCEYIYGCMDILACNYDTLALQDDGSCSYPALGYDCSGTCLNDNSVSLSVREISAGGSTYSLVNYDGDWSLTSPSGDTVYDGSTDNFSTDCIPDGCYNISGQSGSGSSYAFAYSLNGNSLVTTGPFGGVGSDLISIGEGQCPDFISGFTDSIADNNDSLVTDTVGFTDSIADNNDSIVTDTVGCTDSLACNFDLLAEQDNGTCTYPSLDYDCDGNQITLLCGTIHNETYSYSNNDNNSFSYFFQENVIAKINISGQTESCCDDVYVYDGSGNILASLHGSFSETIVSNDNGITLTWDSDASISGYTSSWSVSCNAACPYDVYLEYVEDAESYSDEACLTLITLGCTDAGASNFNPFATSDDGSCGYVFGCTDPIAYNFNSDATTDDGSCVILGCTDAAATNFLITANQDDGSCTYNGCTNSVAENFDPNADIDNGSCIIYGCMLEVFPNYNPIATQSDGSCSFSAEEIILGCTDPNTWTYNPNANFEDGSCLNDLTIGAFGQGGIVFHIDSENEIAYVSAAEDISGSYEWGCFGSQLNGADDIEIGSGYQNTLDIVTNCSESPIAASVALAYELASYSDWYLPSFNELLEMCNSIGPGSNENLGNLYGWYRSSSEENNSRAYVVGMFSGTCGTFDDVEQKYSTKLVRPIRHFSYSASGCTDPSALNYQPNATQDDNSCIAVVEGCLSSWADNYNPQANTSDNSCYVNGCTADWADNYNSQATQDDGSCLLAACNQLWADNYDQNATSNDGSCSLAGCMSEWADNYNAQATIDDGSCALAGCMLDYAENFNIYVTVDDGSCEITGCTNVFAVNYDLSATQDDGSCTYYNTAHIPDTALLNFLKADYPDAIVNDSLNVDSAYLITDINIDLNNNYYEVSSLVGLESCSSIDNIRINGTTISDLSPLYNNTSIREIYIEGSNINSGTLNTLISLQTVIETIEIRYNTSISEFNFLLPNHFMNMILIDNTNIENINLFLDGMTYLDINNNSLLENINGIGNFDVREYLYIHHNPILNSITGSTLTNTQNDFNWGFDAAKFMNNPNLNNCCPLGGFSNFVLAGFELSENGENCNSGAAVNAFYESNCAPGCTDPAALNYNPNISEDDGSCEYCPEIEVVAAVSNISCITNDADVSVTVYPAGNYNFEWSSGQNTSTLYDIPNDSYTVTVTNEDGCQQSLDVVLETPSEISIQANVIDDDLGQCAGEILTTITGGDGTYSYQWYDDNNQTTQNASNLCAGNYLLEVTDGSGCTASASFDVGGGIPWTYGITGSNHTLFIQDSTIFNLYESEISFGDYIGVFYMDESTGELKCGGYTIWQETQVAFPMWGDDPDTEEKDGFYENDLITIGVYNNSEGREYFGASVYFNNFPNSQYFVSNGLSSLQEFNGMPSPTWHVENTGNSHSIMLTEFNPFIGEEPLVYGDFIGIFFNDNDGNLRCGGKTIWTGANNSLTAWGDDGFTPEKDGFTEGETLIWKVWKASQLESYTTIPTFSPNFNPGNYAVNGMSVLLSLDINVNQTLYIPGGWSMFSLNILLDEYSTSNVLVSIVDEIVLVKNFMGMAYLPEYNYNGIGDLNNTEGYQIKLESPQTLTLTGGYIYPENYPLYLPSGWSIVSYLRTEAANAASALAELNENSNLVLAKNYLGQAFLPEFNYNGIGDMAPGQGYQIKLNATDTLIYLANNTAYRMLHLPEVNTQTSLCKVPVCTDNNMTVVIPDHAWVKLPSEDAELIALDALGQLVGCAKYTSPVTVLTLWGDDEHTSEKDGMYVGEQLLFKVLEYSSSKNLSIQNWSEGSDVYQVNAINVASSVSALSETTATTNFNEKQLVKIINLLGQEVMESDAELGRLLFRVYDDGSVEKFIK